MRVETIVWLGDVMVGGVGLETGDRGFNLSCCTVECDLGQVVHTHIVSASRVKSV